MYFSAIPNFCAMALPPGNFCFASVMCLILSTLCKVSNTYQAKICCRLLIPRRLGLLIAAEIGVSDWYQTNAQESSQNMLYIYMGYGYGLWSSIPCHGNPYIFMYIYNIFRCIYIFQWIDHAMAHLPPHGTAADGFSQSQGMVFNKGLGAALSHRENV